MKQNNPNYTDTVGTVKQITINFNGMSETHVYNDEEKKNIQNKRVSDPMQDSIYTLPDRKILGMKEG